MAFTQENFSKLLILLEREKVALVSKESNLRFTNYGIVQPSVPNSRKWIIFELMHLDKDITIKFYVSSQQIRFELNGVSLKDDFTTPFRDEIEHLYNYFIKEWEERQLRNVNDQLNT